MTATTNPSRDEALFRPSDLVRLIQRVGDIAERDGCSVSEAIDRLDDARPIASRIRLGDFVYRLRKVRERRNQLMNTRMFRDPAWDMLLDLFAAHERGEKLSVSALCYGSGVPQSTALRILQRLVEQNMVVREGDPCDMRRSWVHATPAALQDVRTVAGQFVDAVMESACLASRRR